MIHSSLSHRYDAMSASINGYREVFNISFCPIQTCMNRPTIGVNESRKKDSTASLPTHRNT